MRYEQLELPFEDAPVCATCEHDEVSHALVGRLAYDAGSGWLDAAPSARECLADAAPGDHRQCSCSGYNGAKEAT